MNPVKHVPGFFLNVIFQPPFNSAVRAGHQRGGNALGTDAEGPLTSEFIWLAVFL
jgi:hypothetical protein